MEVGHVLQEMLVSFLVLYVFYFAIIGELGAQKGSKTNNMRLGILYVFMSWGS